MKRPGGRKHGTKKMLGLVMVVGMIAAATYAFTASNTVPTSHAGDGASAVSGYTVANVDYNELEGTDTDPSTIESVSFTLSSAADRVKLQLSQTTGKDTWFTCTADSTLNTIDSVTLAITGYGYKCSTSGYAAVDVTNFRVVSYEDSQVL